MKKLFIIVLTVLGAWQAYSAQSIAAQADIKSKAISIVEQFLDSDVMHTLAKAKAIIKSESYFVCDDRLYCSQMDNKLEAQFFLENCPSVHLDIDYDGIACEKQFSEASTNTIINSSTQVVNNSY